MAFTHILVALVTAVLALPVAPAVGDESPPLTEAAPAVPPAVPPSNVFSVEQLDQIVSPVALYPDSLLMQILMASTYPLEVIEAERWMKKNPDLKGDELDKALADETWDPSVKSLTHFPTILARMSDNLDWTKDMGDAFLGQQKDVLDAIQRMRQKAYELGNLKTTPEQNVIVEPAAKAEGQTVVVQQAPPQIIRIEPAQPQVVYVPAYSPAVVYGPPPATVYYPAVYTYPPGYVATASLVSFGVGMAVGAALWGGCDWNSHDVNVNYNYNYTSNKNINNINRKPEQWRHDPQHRKGVNYRNDALAKQYRQPSAADRAARQSARGYERPQGAQARTAATNAGRPNAPRQSRPPSGGSQAKAGRQAGASPQTRANQPGSRSGPGSASRPASTNRATPPSRNTAFASTDSGRAQRAASTRGAASRGVGGGSFARDRGGMGGGGGARYGGGGRGGGGRRR